MLFVGMVVGLLLGMHVVVYKALVSVFQVTSETCLLCMKISLGFLGASFIAAFFISSKFNTFLTRFFYTVSVTWLGTVAFLFFASCLYFVASLFLAQNLEHLLLVGKGLLATALMISIYGVYNANRIVIKPVSIKLKNLPESWKGRRAVFLSDVHLGQVRGVEFSERIARKIKEINPDIIFNTGDLYDGLKVDPVAVIEPFKKLNPPLGTFFVMGNHEEFEDNSVYAKAIEAAGIRVLDNEVTDVEGVQIVGVDYLATSHNDAFVKALGSITLDADRPTILLKHVPIHLETAERAGIDLQLSGHTHRAQIFPLSLITKIIFRGYDYELKPLGNMQVLTTSGVGTWGPPLRVGSNSEIVVITFE